ncbi:sorting nexin-4 [Anaeramoeba ignava]|uniref:Sorting nexin-4 n=1 Tax=Anaeramoeba ignava TaxID=1746090 RepID=A0A9Q0LCN2_ANAIG|nr:sorting nexin-4 [Anaeramoeba ignava]
MSEAKFDWRDEIPPKAQESAKKTEELFFLIGDTWEQIGKSYIEQSNLELDKLPPYFIEYDRIISSFQPVFKNRDHAQLNYHNSQNALIKLERQIPSVEYN